MLMTLHDDQEQGVYCPRGEPQARAYSRLCSTQAQVAVFAAGEQLWRGGGGVGI